VQEAVADAPARDTLTRGPILPPRRLRHLLPPQVRADVPADRLAVAFVGAARERAAVFRPAPVAAAAFLLVRGDECAALRVTADFALYFLVHAGDARQGARQVQLLGQPG